jgi:hypothetical protein
LANSFEQLLGGQKPPGFSVLKTFQHLCRKMNAVQDVFDRAPVWQTFNRLNCKIF